MYIAISFVLLITIATLLTVQQPRFGKLPAGERLERIKKSPNYRNGTFQNKRVTPVLAGDVNFFKVGRDFFFGKRENISPEGSLPSVKTDLIHLDKDKDLLVWFGHSSYFIQIDGRRILVDPVFSGHASPFSFSVKAFKGTDRYTAEDIPEIDYLFITHDHWDHLDYETIVKLKKKIKKVVCGLGTGSHFEYWGFDKNGIIEMDWHEQIILDGFVIHAVPARHFSGRGFKRNQSLWMAFVLKTPSMQLFMGGDGGYDTHFAEIGKTFGPMDLAILENGQYNRHWRYIHTLPDEIATIYNDLQARRLLTVHHSKFALSNHPWYEPLERISAVSKKLNIPLITPMIGELVSLKDSSQKFSEWWKGEHDRF
jgi:L-ascorbate metabolism protein UlaG (beta-lactamase superfamily)